MISLLARDPLSDFGLAAILDSEKIPYRRCDRLTNNESDTWLIAATDLSAEEIGCLATVPCVVLQGGADFVRTVFGADEATATVGAYSIASDAPVWPGSARQLTAAFRIRRLRLPLAPVCSVKTIQRGRVLATFAGIEQPAIVQAGRLVWSSIDLGAAFTHLLGETYLPPQKQHANGTASIQWLRRFAESLYYAAPQSVRQRVQRASYARLLSQVNDLGESATEYPVDASGWLVVQLVRQLLLLVRGGLASLAHWPGPFQAAATMTHDIEPRRYAYTTGINRLLNETAKSESASAFGLVANAAKEHLAAPTAARLEKLTVVCHGLAHRGETVSGRSVVTENVRRARDMLETQLGRGVQGYRSPRLDRSVDLLSALDTLGFRYDSSYPDVDRENVRHFGGGVRFNLPFRPPLYGNGATPRPSRCLELPLTAPDCIQPLFGGASPAELELTVQTKAAFVRASGGLFVALVHAGVFGDNDADRREAHFHLVNDLLHHPDVWVADIADIADWWIAREQVRVETVTGAVRVTNDGPEPIEGLRVVIEHIGIRTLISVPELKPGLEYLIELAHSPEADPSQIALFPHEISAGTASEGREQSSR